MAGTKDLLRWLVSYLNFSIAALANLGFGGWVPSLGWRWQIPGSLDADLSRN